MSTTIQQRVFGVHEEKKQANGLNLTILYCFEDQTAGKIGEILRKQIRRGYNIHHEGWLGYLNINWARMGLQH